MRRLNTRRVKTESIEDPRELLLSLVDMGALDADELLLACIQEMSDAECKRVLNSLTLPSCCGDAEEDEVEDAEFEEPEEDADVEPVEPAEFEEDDDEVESEDALDDEEIAEVESRIRRLEKALKNSSCKRESIKSNRNRISEAKRSRDLGELFVDAMYNGDYNKCIDLIESGIDPNATNKYGMSLLAAAVNCKNVEIAKMLLDAGADPNKPQRVVGQDWYGDRRDTVASKSLLDTAEWNLNSKSPSIARKAERMVALLKSYGAK